MKDNKKAVLFIIFNRPDTTKRVFEVIRKYKPKQLFIAADGPRTNKLGDKERCDETRKVVENVDWPCKVKRLYREKNLGCKNAVSGAINWFFEAVEEGIILEDDCLPNDSFFKFCEHMLDLYRNDSNVMCISGDNFLQENMQKNDVYYFSKYVHIWGWATWRKVWKNYDVKIADWPENKNIVKGDLLEKMYWSVLFDAVYVGKIDTWDYQFVYQIWKNKGVSVCPGVNLVQNIGNSGTHINMNANSKKKNPFKLVENIRLLNKDFSKSADQYEYRHIYRISPLVLLFQFLFYELKRP